MQALQKAKSSTTIRTTIPRSKTTWPVSISGPTGFRINVTEFNEFE